jgi:hypothetical protein
MRETIGLLLEKVRTLLPGFGDNEASARATWCAERPLPALPRFISLNDKTTIDAWRCAPEPAAKRRKISK